MNASKLIASLIRHPVNFAKKVADDIETLNRAEAVKPARVELTADELKFIEAKRNREASK